MTSELSVTSKFAAQFSCYIIGAALGASVGSKIQYLVDGSPTDLRYGGAAVGGLIGWLLTPMLLALAVNIGRPWIRPPSPYADDEKRKEYKQDVIGCSLTLVVAVAVAALIVLTRTLLQAAMSKGLLVLLAVIFGGLFLTMLRSLTSGVDPRLISGNRDFDRAKEIFSPFFNQFYQPDQKLSAVDQATIASKAVQLHNAINLFQSARDSRLSGVKITDNDRQDAAVVLVEIGLVHRLLGDLSQAKDSILQAHRELSALYPSNTLPNLPAKLGIACLRLGDVEHISGMQTTAKEWYKQAIPFLEEASDKANLELARRLLNS